jgi:hypothetical protein
MLFILDVVYYGNIYTITNYILNNIYVSMYILFIKITSNKSVKPFYFNYNLIPQSTLMSKYDFIIMPPNTTDKNVKNVIRNNVLPDLFTKILSPSDNKIYDVLKYSWDNKLEKKNIENVVLPENIRKENPVIYEISLDITLGNKDASIKDSFKNSCEGHKNAVKRIMLNFKGGTKKKYIYNIYKMNRKGYRKSRRSNSRRHSRKHSRKHSQKHMKGGYSYNKKSLKSSRKSRSRTRKSQRFNKRGGFMNMLNKLKEQVKMSSNELMNHPNVIAAKSSVGNQVDKLKLHVENANQKITEAINKGIDHPMAQQAIQSVNQATQKVQSTMKDIASHPSVVGVKSSVNQNVNRMKEHMDTVSQIVASSM